MDFFACGLFCVFLLTRAGLFFGSFKIWDFLRVGFFAFGFFCVWAFSRMGFFARVLFCVRAFFRVGFFACLPFIVLILYLLSAAWNYKRGISYDKFRLRQIGTES